MPNEIRQFVFETLTECFAYMQTPLANYAVFSQKLATRVKIKAGDNEQFDFDVQLDDMVRAGLKKHGITGRVFSEESGFYTIEGDAKYRVVYDPFCNSSLATRTFREGAIGLSIFKDDYTFLTSAILDYQTGILAVVENHKTRFYQLPEGVEVAIDRPRIEALEDAWVVLTLETVEERAHINDAKEIIERAKRVISTSGHLYWLKLAAGFIDAYTDPFGGEELYEMFACTVALHAGCEVTDVNGLRFDPSEYLKRFEEDRHIRFFPVAARSKALHTELLNALT